MSTIEIDVAGGERTPYPVNQETHDALRQAPGDKMGRALVKLRDPGVTRSEEWRETTDLHTGCLIEVRAADCGLGCRCAAEVRLVWLPEDHVRVRTMNTYTCGRQSGVVVDVSGPPARADESALDEWWSVMVGPSMGDGHPCGSREHALYEAWIVAAPGRPELVGLEYSTEG